MPKTAPITDAGILLGHSWSGKVVDNNNGNLGDDVDDNDNNNNDCDNQTILLLQALFDW